MLGFITLSGIIVLIAFFIYLFKPPAHLKEVPTVPLLPFLYSIITREPVDKRSERLVLPILYQHGVAKIWLSGWVVIVSKLEPSKDILNKINTFTKDIFLLSNPHSLLQKFFGTNVVFSSGEVWRRHRKVVNPAFHRSWSTKLVGGCCETLVAKIDEIEGPVEVLPLLKRMTLDALGKAVFDYDFKAIENPEGEYVTIYSKVMRALENPIFLLFPFLENPIFNIRSDMRDKAGKFRKLIKMVMDEKKEQLDNNKEMNIEDMDLLTLMLKATEASDEKEAKLSEKEMIDNMVTFFAAGHDTTANTLAFALYYLSINPMIQEKARKEIQKIVADPKGIPTQSELKELHYITAFIYEVMRIKPTVNQLMRNTSESIQLLPNLIIPPNQYVGVNLYAMLHDKTYWDNPEDFNPERFLEYSLSEDGKEIYNINKSVTKAWHPFGYGPRACIGLNFSIMEQRIVLAMILNKFKLSLPKNSPHSKELICSSGGLSFPVELKVHFSKIEG